MRKTTFVKLTLSTLAVMGLGAMTTKVHASFIQLTNDYIQNFDTLNSSGKSKSLPPGWAIASQDGQIYADNGSMSQANIYSYGPGPNGSSDRALGLLASGGNLPIFGASFQNSGSGPINRLNISYTGEEWRLGLVGHANTLNFQYSLNASGVKDQNATWINVPSLSFTTPNLSGAGAHNGALAANQSQISGSISFLNIPIGQTFWIRWQELRPSSPGDGLAVDNFHISAVPEASTDLAAFGALTLIGATFWKKRRSLQTKTA